MFVSTDAIVVHQCFLLIARQCNSYAVVDDSDYSNRDCYADALANDDDDDHDLNIRAKKASSH